MGAGNLSYFSYANWATDCWTLAGTTWWPELDRPIGWPTSPANTRLPGKRWKYARNFSTGTSVYVDVATRVVEIKWADSGRTPPPLKADDAVVHPAKLPPCNSSLNCSLNGACAGGVCRCDQGWVGTYCQQLALLPVVNGTGLE
jgi:hypothetical protein